MYTSKQKSALKELLKHDPHLIRCNPNYLNWTLPENQTKETLDKIKKPIENLSWKKKSTDEEILSHIERGGLIAIKPWSLGCTAFDVDEGDGSGVISELGEPAFVCDSRRENGKHIFYKSTSPVDQVNFQHGSDKGETRCDDGYLILWHPEQLDLEALKNSKAIAYSLKRKTTATAHQTNDNLPSLEKMRDILSKINPDCDYDKWREIGMGLKNEYKCEGFMLWDEWSSQGKKYKGREMSQKWDTFSYDGELGVGTILHHAQVYDLLTLNETFDPAYIKALGIVENEFSKNGLVITKASQIKPEPIDWLVDKWFARGMLHLLAGATGSRKIRYLELLCGSNFKGFTASRWIKNRKRDDFDLLGRGTPPKHDDPPAGALQSGYGYG